MSQFFALGGQLSELQHLACTGGHIDQFTEPHGNLPVLRCLRSRRKLCPEPPSPPPAPLGGDRFSAPLCDMLVVGAFSSRPLGLPWLELGWRCRVFWVRSAGVSVCFR